MKILQRKRGDEFFVSNCLKLTVLEINSCRVKFGVYEAMVSRGRGVLSRRFAELCRNKSCYFWFPKNGCCMLVLSCAKGIGISLTGDICITVLDINGENVTLAVTGLPLIDAFRPKARQIDRRRETVASAAKTRRTRQCKTWANRARPLHVSPARFWRRHSLRS